jgi:hypothetical protein
MIDEEINGSDESSGSEEEDDSDDEIKVNFDKKNTNKNK